MERITGSLAFGHKSFNLTVPAGTQSLCLEAFATSYLYIYLADPSGNIYRSTFIRENDKKNLIANMSVTSEECWKIHVYNMENEGMEPVPLDFEINCRFEKAPVAAEQNGNMIPVVDKSNNIVFPYDRTLNQKSGWYKGDLHAHTAVSDGQQTLGEAQDYIEQAGLDFFFFTEHNAWHRELPASDKTLFLPAMELTTTQGHFNILGLRQLPDFTTGDCSSHHLIQQGLDKGDIISINHPMTPDPWNWHYNDLPLSAFESLEVIAEPAWPTSREAVDRAIPILNTLWNNGYRVTAVGGSDCHLKPHERYDGSDVPNVYGDPTTLVFAHGLSGNAIIEGLRAGRVLIERGCGLDVQINHGDNLPGDQVTDTVHYSLSVTSDSETYKACFIADGNVVHTQSLSRDTPVTYQTSMSDIGWLRVDIYRQDGLLEAVVNPVFNQLNPPQISNWGELLAAAGMQNN